MWGVQGSPGRSPHASPGPGPRSSLPRETEVLTLLGTRALEATASGCDEANLLPEGKFLEPLKGQQGPEQAPLPAGVPLLCAMTSGSRTTAWGCKRLFEAQATPRWAHSCAWLLTLRRSALPYATRGGRTEEPKADLGDLGVREAREART